MNEATHRFRFSLRTLLLVVLLVAVVAAFPMTLWFVAWNAPIIGPVVGVVAFLLVWRAARPDRAANRWPSFLGWFIGCLALLPLRAA